MLYVNGLHELNLQFSRSWKLKQIKSKRPQLVAVEWTAI